MKFSDRKPEIYDRLHAQFGVNWEDALMITYGDTVYTKYPLTADLIIHEQVHINQQEKEGGPIVWWNKYLDDPVFRLMVELEAYRAQIQYLKAFSPRKYRKERIKKIHHDISTYYGGICTLQEAQDLLK